MLLRGESTISVESYASGKLCVGLRDTFPLSSDPPWYMARPGGRVFSARRGFYAMGYTLARFSIRFSASVWLRGVEPLDYCSPCDIVETMKGISCASTPSFARSSEVMERDPGESLLVSESCPRRWGLGLTLGGPNSSGRACFRTSGKRRRADRTSLEAVLAI